MFLNSLFLFAAIHDVEYHKKYPKRSPTATDSKISKLSNYFRDHTFSGVSGLYTLSSTTNMPSAATTAYCGHYRQIVMQYESV